MKQGGAMRSSFRIIMTKVDRWMNFCIRKVRWYGVWWEKCWPCHRTFQMSCCAKIQLLRKLATPKGKQEDKKTLKGKSLISFLSHGQVPTFIGAYLETYLLGQLPTYWSIGISYMASQFSTTFFWGGEGSSQMNLVLNE